MDISSSCVIFVLALLTIFPTSLCRLSREFKTCSQLFNCGNMTNISYPFYGLDRPSYCGHPGFELLGCDQIVNPITMMIKSQTFQLQSINYTTSTITVARDDFKRKSGCPDYLNNITIDFSIFQYTPQDANLTLFYGNCSKLCNATSTFKEFLCPMIPEAVPFCWLTKNAMLESNISQSLCPASLFLPIHTADNTYMDQVKSYTPYAAWNGFELEWNANNGLCQRCLRSGGQCGHEPQSNRFFCFCTDESKCPFPGSIPHKKTLNKSKIALLGSFLAIGLGVLTVLLFYLRRRCTSKVEDAERKRKQDVDEGIRYKV